MDFLSPAIGAVTGIEMAQWKDIFIFAFKVVLLCVPFAILGLLLDGDIYRVPVTRRLVKSVVAVLFVTPVIMLGVLNYMADGLSDAFWAKYPFLESYWIMEGKWPPAVLALLALLFLILYLLETATGDLTN